jgi:polysaccharide deacetylase family protein (PEP-CTERM system associated)
MAEMNQPDTLRNALTVDVEDYFHVSAFAGSIKRADWDSLECRVEANTRKLLQLFDSASVSGTFFVLGWVAERYPGLVREIVAGGHELACHGYSHRLIYTQGRREFREETLRAKKLLEDIGGVPVNGYRAASYSITSRSTWAISMLVEAGFRYDSSIVPVKHDLYGIRGARPHPYRMRLSSGHGLVEFPPSTIDLVGVRVPIAGGGYFRFFPYWFSRWGMNRVNADGQPFSFYLHPWEIDAEQPRIDAPLKSRFRHYNNLEKCEPRLCRLLGDFRFASMQAVLDAMQLDDVDVDITDLGELAGDLVA